MGLRRLAGALGRVDRHLPGHAREDLPEIVSTLRDKHPGMAFELQRAVGEEPRLLDLLADIAGGTEI